MNNRQSCPAIETRAARALGIALLLIGVCGVLNAQFLVPNLTFYRQNWELINPAALNRWLYWDKDDHQQHTISFAGRYQWFGAGLEGSPRFFNASYEWSPENKNFKAGGTFYADQAGAISVFCFTPSISASVEVDPLNNRKLSGGLGVRYCRYQVDDSKFRYNIAQGVDPVVEAWKGAHNMMDLSAGLFFHQVKIFYVGLSVPQVFAARYAASDTTRLKQKIAPHFYLTGGYYWRPTEDEKDGFFEFSTIARIVPNLSYAIGPLKKMSAEINARYWLRNERFWLGGGYSTNRLMNLEVGCEFIKKGVNNSHNKLWRDRFGLVFTGPAGRLAAPFGYQVELTYSHAWY